MASLWYRVSVGCAASSSRTLSSCTANAYSRALRASTFQRRYASAAVKVAAAPQTENPAVAFSTLKGKISEKTLEAITVSPFKLTEMSPVQAEVLPLLPRLAEPYNSEGGEHVRDLMVRAKTGTGKTLAFLIPAIEARLKTIQQETAGAEDPRQTAWRFARRTVGTLVISPTRELATQIANEAHKLTHHHDFEVRLFTGGTSKRMQMRDWLRGRKDIVVATPGRLRDLLESEPDVRAAMEQTKILIFDEADTLLDMGFREDIEEIKRFLPPTPDRQTFLFSATISRQIQQVARSTLAPNHKYIDCITDDVSPVHAHVDQYHTVLPSANAQIPHILRLIAQDQLTNPGKSKTVLFLPTTKMTQLFATLLNALGPAILPAGRNTKIFEIHSKRTQDKRTVVSDAFRSDKSGASVLVTSDVSARGVDYPGVSRVIQVGIPGGREQYIHRVGRTGRAGTAGRGDLVLLPWEIGFVTWQLADVPLKPLASNELIDQVKTLAGKHDEDPAAFFAQSPAKARLFPRQAVTPLVEDAERSVETLLGRLDPEAIRETFLSLLGYYMPKSPELRVQKSVVVQGCQDWATGACGLATPPYVSADFLQRLGLGDGRTKHFGKARHDMHGGGRSGSAPWNHRGGSSRAPAPWMGRGAVAGRGSSPSAAPWEQVEQNESLDAEENEYKSGRYRERGPAYRPRPSGSGSFGGYSGGTRDFGGDRPRQPRDFGDGTRSQRDFGAGRRDGYSPRPTGGDFGRSQRYTPRDGERSSFRDQ